MDCDDLKLSLYLDGELADREEMERHLSECAKCRSRLEQFRGADAELERAAGRFAPPGAKPVLVRRRRWWRIPAVAAALVLVAMTAGLVWVNVQEADPQEVHVVAGTLWHSGTRTVARVLVSDHRGGRPVAGASVRGRVRIGERVLESPAAQTASNGSAELAFDLPSDLEGAATLTVEVSSALASDTLTGSIRIERPARILLTTDKPVYQPTQEIHIRSLTMDNFRMKPYARTSAVIEIEDPNGTKVYKKEGTTSDFGIFAVDFRLADEVILGRWRIRARVAAVESERTVEVSRYVLPKFGVTVTTDSSFYAPGDTIRGTVEARYFFPRPVADGRVELSGPERLSGRLDSNGRWTFEMRLTPHEGDVPLEATVVDGAGQTERKKIRIPVSRDPIVIEVVPVFGEVVAGIDNSLFVITTYPDGRPARCELTTPGGSVATDSAGVGVVAIGRRLDPVRIDAKDGAGRRASLTYHPSSRLGAKDFALQVEPTARAGETLSVTAYAARDLTLFVDLVKNDQTILTRTLEVRAGRGVLPLDLPTELTGTVRLSAYRIREDGDIVRDSRVVIVDLPTELQIRPKLSKSEYRPGEEISIEFEVLDSTGRPVVSAITLGVVDEAVYALAEARPGLERDYFRIVEDLLKPRYQLKAPMTDRVRAAAAQESEENRAVARCRHGDKQDTINRWINRHNERARIAGAIAGIAFFLVLVIGTFVYAVREAVRGRVGCIVAEAVVCGILLCGGFFALFSQHPKGMALRSETTGGGGATGSKSDPAKSDPPRLREWFPETLYWNSEILTDEHGRARVRFRGADSITTWRMTMSAVSRDGRLGSGVDGIKVFQPFFVDLDLPVSLTQGDELWVPVAVYNFTDKRDTVTLRFTAEAGIDLLDPAEKSVEVEPQRVTSILYRIRAAKFGTHRLEVLATAASFADRVARTLEVMPDGKAFPFAAGDRLRTSSRLQVEIPRESIEGAHRTWVRLYPSSFSEIVTGLEALVRMPYG